MKPCRCHSDDSLYGSLSKCPACGHRSYDPDIGCERRKCAHVVPAEPTTVKPDPRIEAEHRDNRPYDATDASTLIFPAPFRLAATFSRALTPSMTTEAIKAHRRELGLGEWWD